MNQALKQYLDAARAKGHTDDRIKDDLVAAGWDRAMVEAGLSGDDSLVPPPPPPPSAATTTSATRQPQAVVESFSTRGFEYIIMFIALGVAALSLGSLLHSNVNTLMGGGEGTFSDSVVSFAAAALVVALPVLAVLFLRLKKLEQADPELLHDTSRKRAVQLTLVITFLIGLGNIIFFVYDLMTGGSNTSSYTSTSVSAAANIIGNFVHLLITLGIAGGIFAYYWRDEHRKN